MRRLALIGLALLAAAPAVAQNDGPGLSVQPNERRAARVRVQLRKLLGQLVRVARRADGQGALGVPLAPSLRRPTSS